MELVALQSLMNAEVSDVLGCLSPPRARCFQCLGGFPSTPAPALLKERVHPLLSRTSPSEYVAACHLPITPKGSGRLL
jgi:hypothetical protein